MPIEYTGFHASPEEWEDILNLVKQGWQPGETVIVSSIMQGITKDQKTLDARITCHKLALAHGLPEIDGYYGLSNDGEFVRAT